jgi:NAD(P)H-flavin reductase
VSGALVRGTAPGDTVLLGPAEGAMTLDPDSARDLLLIGGGTGLSPVKALAEQAAHSGRGIRLLVAARTADDLYDLPDLRLLESACPRLRVVPVLSRAPESGALTGRVPDVLPGLLDDAAGLTAYVAGPVPLVRETVAALLRLGVPLQHVHHDLLTAGDPVTGPHAPAGTPSSPRPPDRTTRSPVPRP